MTTNIESRMQALRAELDGQVEGLHDIIVRPLPGDLFELIALEERGPVDVGAAGIPSWASVVISRQALTGSFSDFGATVDNAAALLKQQLDDSQTPPTLAADAAVLQTKTVPQEGEGEKTPDPTVSSPTSSASPASEPAHVKDPTRRERTGPAPAASSSPIFDAIQEDAADGQ